MGGIRKEGVISLIRLDWNFFFLFGFFAVVLFVAVLRIESRALHMLGTHFTTKPHPQLRTEDLNVEFGQIKFANDLDENSS